MITTVNITCILSILLICLCSNACKYIPIYFMKNEVNGSDILIEGMLPLPWGQKLTLFLWREFSHSPQFSIFSHPLNKIRSMLLVIHLPIHLSISMWLITSKVEKIFQELPKKSIQRPQKLSLTIKYQPPLKMLHSEKKPAK